MCKKEGNPVPLLKIENNLIELRKMLIINSDVDWNESNPNEEFRKLTINLSRILLQFKNGVETDNERPCPICILHPENCTICS